MIANQQWQTLRLSWRGIIGVLVARPLIAIALAAIVVVVGYLAVTRRQTTPVTHRTERVGLTDERLEAEHLTRIAAAIIAGGVAFTPQQYFHVLAALGVAEAAASLSFSRKQESEADHIGLVYMARAGYEPREALSFWTRMLRASKGKEPPEFASDHPSDAHRIERIRGWLPEAEREYTPQPQS